jgi:hypothetical protein
MESSSHLSTTILRFLRCADYLYNRESSKLARTTDWGQALLDRKASNSSVYCADQFGKPNNSCTVGDPS